MGLRETVAKAALSAFTAVGDLVDDATYTRVTIGAYNPATDVQVETANNISITGVLVREKVRENDDSVTIDRTQFIFPSLGFPFTPSEDDYITILGIRYEINDIKHVPGRAIYTLFLRAT